MAIGNSVSDEIREQHNKLKGKTFKEKFDYFWEYYKVHTIVTIIVIACLSQFIYSIATQKDTVLEVAFVNTVLDESIDSEQLSADVTTLLGYDFEKCESSLYTGMYIDYEGVDQMSAVNIQKITAMVASNSLDILLVDDNYLEHSYKVGMFGDLSEMLPADVFAKYEDKMIYRDIEDDEKGEVPVAIDVRDSGLLMSPELPAWFALAPNTVRIEESVKFLEYMMEQ